MYELKALFLKSLHKNRVFISHSQHTTGQVMLQMTAAREQRYKNIDSAGEIIDTEDNFVGSVALSYGNYKEVT